MSYRPKIKTNTSGGLTDFPLDAETVKGVDVVTTKQDLLVDSGVNQNIKTLNGNSILGSGDLTITAVASDEKARKLLGEFDVYPYNNDDTKVLRQTGLFNLSKFILDNKDKAFFRSTVGGYQLGPVGLDTRFFPNCVDDGHSRPVAVANYNFITSSPDELWGNVSDYKFGYQYVSLPNTYDTLDKYLQYFGENEVIVQYKLANSYIDSVIPSGQILNLDNNGCQFVRDEWEKQLNLFTTSKFYNFNNTTTGAVTYTSNSINDDNAYAWDRCYFEYTLKPNTTYTYSYINSNGANAKNTQVQYPNSDGTAIEVYDTIVTFTTGSTGVVRITMYFALNDNPATSVTLSNIMLNYGTHPYPYQDFYGKIMHEKDVSDNYLKLSGGSITGNLDVNGATTLYNSSNDYPLALKSNTAKCYLLFKDSNGNNLGWYGVNDSGKPLFYTTSTGDKKIITEMGGQFTGPISFANDTALPQKTLEFVMGMDRFASGGQVGWQTKANFLADWLKLSDNTSGAVIFRNTDTPLNLKSNSLDTYLGFKDANDNMVGWYGITRNHVPVFNWNNTNYTIITSAGGDFNGSISLLGSDLILNTPSSSSHDSGDIRFNYGNGNEKARIWTPDTYSSMQGPYYRCYDGSGNSIYSGRLAIPEETVQRLSWWNYEDSHDANDLRSGTTFAYSSHNTPTTGTIVAFSSMGNGTNYTLQLQGSYGGEELWFRNRQGDINSWQSWKKLALANQLQRIGNTAYYNLGAQYFGGSQYSYYRVKIPVQSSSWSMFMMEFSIRQDYNNGYAGKLIVSCYNYNGNPNAQGFKCFVDGFITNSIKVYASGREYIYIAGINGWGGLTFDRLMLGDNIVEYDLTNTIEIDAVNELPSGYQTANMYYGALTADLPHLYRHIVFITQNIGASSSPLRFVFVFYNTSANDITLNDLLDWCAGNSSAYAFTGVVGSKSTYSVSSACVIGPDSSSNANVRLTYGSSAYYTLDSSWDVVDNCDEV